MSEISDKIQTLVPDFNLNKDFFTTKELGEKFDIRKFHNTI